MTVIFMRYFSLKKNDFIIEIDSIKVEKGLSLQILLKEINNILMRTDWSNQTKMFLTKRLCELEYRMSLGCSEKLQLGALVGAFNEIRHIKE